MLKHILYLRNYYLLILPSFHLQAHQIANLIREYMDVLQSPPEVPKRESAIAQQIAQQPIQQPSTNLTAPAGGRKSRPASVLHRGAPVIQSQAS